jgi:HlyD family secretion protein
MMFKNVLSISLLLFITTSCKQNQETIYPVEEKITESVYASGVIKSLNQYQVFSSMNGLVAEVLVQEGDMVNKGDAIIKLTNTTAQLNTESAGIAAEYATTANNMEKLNDLKNSVQLAKSKMDLDASLLERQRNLWNQQIGTRNELEQREIAFKNSQTIYETAKLKYTDLQKHINFQDKQAQKNLQILKTITSDYTIKSALKGKVYSLLKSEGEMVNTQSPVALIGDAADFMLELQVDEYDIARIKKGQKILVSMDSYKGEIFEAVVDKINPLMNERSKSFTIEARFENQPAALFPNLTCEANIVITTKEKALTIPRVCLIAGDFVILENEEKRKVTTGLKDYNKVEILSGLTTKDVILKPKQ